MNKKIDNSTRCNFFIPNGINDLIKEKGDRKLFEKQYDNMKNFDFSIYPEIKEIAETIKSLKKGLPQEILIK